MIRRRFSLISRSRGIVAALIMSAAAFAQAQPATLFAYVGAGIKEPVIALVDEYQKKTGVKVEMTFNNMGSLLSQLQLSKSGDLFIPGGMPFVQKATAAGLIAETSKPMAYHVPVIVVPKGNPGGIATIRDLARPGVKLVLPDRKATALGISAFKVFDKLGISSAVETNVLSYAETPEKVLIALKMGQGDAGIADFSATTRDRDVFDIIDIDASINEVEKIPCAALSCSANKDAAHAFMLFAEKEGPAFFAKYGFRVEP
jgi:molybdate transport system substrate-binding protein